MTKRRPWPPADLATLRQRYPHEPTARIAADMGRTARVEVDYLKVTGQDVSNFIDGHKAPGLPAPTGYTATGTLDRSTPGRVVHRLRGDDQ